MSGVAYIETLPGKLALKRAVARLQHLGVPETGDVVSIETFTKEVTNLTVPDGLAQSSKFADPVFEAAKKDFEVILALFLPSEDEPMDPAPNASGSVRASANLVVT